MAVLQWNCRGLRANYEEVQLLVSSFNPHVLCLQETFVKSTDYLSFRGFVSYLSPASDTAAGGVAILIRDAPSSPVSLSTSLQAVAARVTLHRPLTICSLYIPPPGTRSLPRAQVVTFIILCLHINFALILFKVRK